MSSTSYWQTELNTAELANRFHVTIELPQGSSETEVAIVGAGITGTVAALYLARAGLKVMVLEGRSIAAGASGRNAGFITSTTGEKYAAVVARLGREHARRLWEFHAHNAQLAARLLEELDALGWPCEYRQRGLLGLAGSEAELAEITTSAALLNEDGWQAELLERRELPRQLQEAYYGGILHPQSGELHPARFVMGLAMLAQRTGAVFYVNSPVITLTENEQGVVLTTPQGSVRARTVMLATNAWLPELGKQLGANWLSRCIKPTRGQVIATEPINRQIFPYSCSANEGYQYWRQLSDGRLIVGGWRNMSFATEATTDETPNEQVQRHLDAFVHETPGLSDVQIEHRWAGIMAFSKDGLPLIGKLPGTEHCYIAGGYTGHGNASALQAAMIIRGLILARTHPEADLFDPGRFIKDQ